MEPFSGTHQAGIVTDTQRQTVLAAFDLTTSNPGDLAALLIEWTSLASFLAAGQSVTVPIFTPPGGGGADAYADATGGSTTDDSLEAYGLGPNRLTLTVGFGRSLFVTSSGEDRFGISGKLPPALISLPRFPGDELTAADSDGDLFLQACADDPQVAFHAVRAIARVAPDVATLRWTQVGFSPDNTGGTPRNLMGFKDGTMNSNVHPPADLQATLWAGPEGPGFLHPAGRGRPAEPVHYPHRQRRVRRPARRIRARRLHRPDAAGLTRGIPFPPMASQQEWIEGSHGP
jgi:deferrochelatase/peroxidase EfeB